MMDNPCYSILFSAEDLGKQSWFNSPSNDPITDRRFPSLRDLSLRSLYFNTYSSNISGILYKTLECAERYQDNQTLGMRLKPTELQYAIAEVKPSCQSVNPVTTQITTTLFP